MEKRNTLKGSLELMLAALIWGVSFVAQRVGMEYVEPFTFNGVRNLIGGIFLLVCLPFLDRTRRAGQAGSVRASGKEDTAAQRKLLLQGGLVCGFFVFIASNLQQIGIKYTSVGKAGFITAMYIVIVPVLGIFIGRRIGLRLWISVALAVIGLYLLSMTGSFSLSRGDLLVLLCALAFAFQIMAVDYYADRVDNIRLACMEFWVCGLLSMIPMALFEHPTLSGLWAARVPLLYAGVLSCGVAYTLQITGQKLLSPALASLIMSFESVISALAGWLILHQKLSARELCGCAVMFAAILLAQLPADLPVFQKRAGDGE